MPMASAAEPLPLSCPKSCRGYKPRHAAKEVCTAPAVAATVVLPPCSLDWLPKKKEAPLAEDSSRMQGVNRPKKDLTQWGSYTTLKRL